MIEHPMAVLAVLLLVLATLFALAGHPRGKRFFKVVPLLLFAYFVPTLLSNTGVIPLTSPLYDFITLWLLPSSLFLLTLSVDIPAILKLGRNVLFLFLGATATIVIGGPLAYLALGWLVPVDMRDQAWRGLAAMSGSWIGGGANFLAIGESAGAEESTINMIVVVDIAITSIWMAALLFFAGRDARMDAKIGADRASIDTLRAKVEAYQAGVRRPTTLADLLLITALCFGGTAAATALAGYLSKSLFAIGGFLAEIEPLTWTVLLVTALGVALSFTRLRRLEGAGASATGNLFLYLLIATIGAKGNFAALLEAPAFLAIAAIWMCVHAGGLLALRRLLRAPVFFLAVGSQANIGGAASAPAVASAFHPSLAPVGVLLAVAGYALGTYAGLLCMFLLEMVHQLVYG